MITKKYLHEIEMELVNMCNNFDGIIINEISIKNEIINKFTDLISKVTK